MAFTINFLTVEQFTAARTLLIEATLYILLRLILNKALAIHDTRRLSRGRRVKLTGLTARTVLKALLDVLLIAAAVTSELRTDVVLVHRATTDERLLQNQRALADVFARPSSEAPFRQLDSALTARVGVCDWRTSAADASADISLFRGAGFASAVKLADAFQSVAQGRLQTVCSAQRRQAMAMYDVGVDSLLVQQGSLNLSRFTWGGAGVLQRFGDTKLATTDVHLVMRNRTLVGAANLMCTVYVSRNFTGEFDVDREAIMVGLRERSLRAMQCGGVLRGGDFEENGFQNLVMFYLATEFEFVANDAVSTGNFITLQTDQKLQPAEVYLASRSISPGFLTYQGRMRRGVTIVMADRLAQDIVEGMFQVCGGGCEGFQVSTSTIVAARTDFIVELVLILVVLVAGTATWAASIYYTRCAQLDVTSSVDRILATHRGCKGAPLDVERASPLYLSLSRRSSAAGQAATKRRAPAGEYVCEIGT